MGAASGSDPTRQLCLQRSNIYELEELTWRRIDALDRARASFILPVRMIEEHGPHLPVGADTIGVRYEADGASRRVSRAMRDWSIVLMPPSNHGRTARTRQGRER